MQAGNQRLILTPPKLVRILGVVLAFLFFMHALTLVVAHGFGFPVARGFVPLFHVDHEHNIPTFVAFVLLICCGLVSAWSSALETRRLRHRRAWAMLAVLFLALAADEAFGFHEQLGVVLFAEFGKFGLPMYAWVVPYGLAVFVLGLFFLRWFFELESGVRLSLALAGSVFLFGAIGIELLASGHYESLPVNRPDFRTLQGDLLSTFEEACEFAGASLFLHTVLTRLGGISFRALGETQAGAPTR